MDSNVTEFMLNLGNLISGQFLGHQFGLLGNISYTILVEQSVVKFFEAIYLIKEI